MAETYYSVGGGFVVKEPGIDSNEDAYSTYSNQEEVLLPFPINTADELLHWCMKTGMPISEIVLEK
jgi:L-serine dehydratase